MAPGRKCDRRNEGKSKKSGNFSLNTKSDARKGSSVKKEKYKAIHKKKLKDQAKKWIADVNKSFEDVQSELASNTAKKLANEKQAKQHRNKEKRIQTMESDVTDAEISSTIADMANLLQQTE